MRGATVAVSWVLTRLLVLWLLVGPERRVVNSLDYLSGSVRGAAEHGVGHALVEYPLAAVGVLAVPVVVAALTGVAFPHALAGIALLTDAGFALLLWRCGGPRREAATWVWVLGVPLLGATAYARFDLLPGALVGIALLLHRRRPQVAATAAAVATAVKLWPVLVLPGLVAGVRRRGPVVVTAALVLVVTAVATVALGGLPRLLSPLRYDAERGLQIEAVAATPAMLGRWLHPHWWRVFFAASRSFEVTGPGVDLLLVAARVATVVLALALLAAWWAAWRRRAPVGPEVVAWLVLAPVAGFVVTSKVLSPQYLLWLLPAAAAALAVVPRRSRALTGWSVLLLLATGLTQLLFPLLYQGLLHRPAEAAAAVAVLALRNLVLVVLALTAWVQLVRVLRADRADRAYAATRSTA